LTTDAAARATIEVWFLAHEAGLANPSHEGEEASAEQWASLKAALRAAGVSASGPQAQDILSRKSSSTTSAGASNMLLGEATGSCFGRVPTQRRLAAAERLVRTDAGWAAFSAAAAAEARSDGPGLVALATCLEELVHAFTSAPRRIVYAHRDNMCALVEHYRLQPRLDDLWSSGRSRIMLVKHEPAFDALRMSEPGSFLQMLDAFPHPEPGRHILGYTAKRMDLDGLLALLALARPCFDAGDWLPWVKTPVLIVTSIGAKLAILAAQAEDGTSAASDAFTDATRKAVRGVLERADGIELGHAWLQRLIQERAFEWTRPSGGDRPRPDFHDRLQLELASALSPRRGVFEWVQAEQDICRRDRAVAAIAAAGLGEAGSCVAAATLMGQVLQLGLPTIAQEGGFSGSSSPERQLMAAVIGRDVAPAAWFDDLWRGLAPVRDRARHARTSAGCPAGDATVIAVTWFLFGLDAVDVSAPAHGALWRSLHSAVREGAMTQTSPLAQTAWRARYRFLAAHLAYRLVTLADEETTLDLQDLLGPMLCLDMTLAEVVAVLFDAGVAPAVIAAGAGRPARLVELLRRLEAEQAWREARQKEQLGSQSGFSHAIARMADMIEGVTLATS